MKKHINNFILNSLPFFIGLLPSIIAIPIYLKYLGGEGLGVYYLYLAIVGIGGTFDFGIPQTLVKYISEYRFKSIKFVQLTIYSTTAIMFIVNIIIILVALFLFFIVHFTPWLNDIGNSSIALFTIGLILQTWYNYFISILKGYERFKKIAFIEAQNKVLFTGLGIILAIFFKNVNYVIFAHIFSLIVQNFYLFVQTKYIRNDYSLALKFEFFKRYLWNYSKWILVQNTIGFFNGNIDKFIIATYINLNSLAVYNTARNIANLFPAFFSKGMSYLLPHVSKIDNKEKIKSFYIKSSYIFNVILALIYFIVVLISPFVIKLYLNGNPEVALEVTNVFRFLLISSIFMCTSLLSFNFFNGIGEVKTNTVIPFYGNVISIIIVILGGYFWGFWGVVFTKMNNVILSMIVRTVTYNKIFKPKNNFIGFKMALPILISIILIEVLFLFN